MGGLFEGGGLIDTGGLFEHLRYIYSALRVAVSPYGTIMTPYVYGIHMPKSVGVDG